jgi:hypothetical protein
MSTVTTICTFGAGQVDPRTGHSMANRFVRVEAATRQAARAAMFERFGKAWAFDYRTEEEAGVRQYGLVEIDFETGLDL